MARGRQHVDLLRISVRGAGRRGARALNRDQRILQDELNRTINVLGQRATKAIRESGAVPEDTKNLVRSIRPVFFTRASRVQVTIRADAERDGYRYAGVTRFGHKVSEIKPKAARGGAGGGRRAPSLRMRLDMGYSSHYDDILGRHFTRVKAVQVEQDWMELTIPYVNRPVRLMQEQLGRQIQKKVLNLRT